MSRNVRGCGARNVNICNCSVKMFQVTKSIEGRAVIVAHMNSLIAAKGTAGRCEKNEATGRDKETSRTKS